jgi:hypothetical protein
MPGQTASLAALITYTFMEPLIRAARRTEHLPAASLPPRADADGLRALHPRMSAYLTPSPNRKTRVLLGLIDSFKTQWAVQVLLCAAGSFAQLGSPIGTNRLLSCAPVPRGTEGWRTNDLAGAGTSRAAARERSCAPGCGLAGSRSRRSCWT